MFGRGMVAMDMLIAGMYQEPVAYTDERNLGYIDRGRETAYLWGKQNSEASDVALYRHAQPAPERYQVRREHAEWSQATFGSVGPIGPLKHLSKEALEAAAEPGDLSEWADMQFLLWDAQRRAGITDEQITLAMIEKLAVNKQREWPAPKDGEPRLHIKELPAPVVMDDIKLRELFDSWFASDCSFDRSPEASEEDNIAWRESYWYVWQRCRAAMLQELQKSAGEPNNCRSSENVQVMQDETQSRAIFEKWCSVNIERNKWHPEFYAHLPAREQWAAWEACRAAMLAAAPQGVPDGK
ncbi:DUF550 domain-containing protein [Klebsiella michiganensis]